METQNYILIINGEPVVCSPETLDKLHWAHPNIFNLNVKAEKIGNYFSLN